MDRPKATIQEDYVERVYAGWLGKIIGVRHGGNIEQWTYERIADTFGEISGYLHEYKHFAADDDMNGPVFFMRALEDYTHTEELTAEQIGKTWLNYAPDGHSFFWWGGYGRSAGHTAYLNMKNGIMPPHSGSAAQNGRTVSEQIDGQIFIDPWGLIAPGNPEQAARYARKSASVSHDGNGVFGGMFIAACIAAAFVESDMLKIIEAGLSVIPESCQYAVMARDVVGFWKRNPEDWRSCFRFVHGRYGYDKYPGNCHIIPNSAVIVLSLLYGKGDFSDSINICNMCGWDTDCNVGNVGTIMGVRNGPQGIGDQWRKPINDFLCCSSVIGTLNAWDIPRIAAYTAAFGYRIAGEEPPASWKPILEGEAARFHFEFPGSTHTFRTATNAKAVTSLAVNTDEEHFSGSRCLKLVFDYCNGGFEYRAGVKTYYMPEDFNDSRYDPAFSPALYPGQTIRCRTMLHPRSPLDMTVRLFVKDRNGDVKYTSEPEPLPAGSWKLLSYTIPSLSGALIEEAGIEFIPVRDLRTEGRLPPLIAYLDDFDFAGKPDYEVDFRFERIEKWSNFHSEVSQMTYLRGYWTLEEGELRGSYSGESAECYTGDLRWRDYSFTSRIIPYTGEQHYVLFRVQGGIRSYRAGFDKDGKVGLYKNENGRYRLLAAAPFEWQRGQEYKLSVDADGDRMDIQIDGRQLIRFVDKDQPYLHGQVGFANEGGSRTGIRSFSIQGR